MPTTIDTARGIYTIINRLPSRARWASIILTLTLDRADGIEKVALRCRVANALPSSSDTLEKLIERLAPWRSLDL